MTVPAQLEGRAIDILAVGELGRACCCVAAVDQHRHQDPAPALGQPPGELRFHRHARRQADELFRRLVGVGDGDHVGDRPVRRAPAAVRRRRRRRRPASARRTRRSLAPCATSAGWLVVLTTSRLSQRRAADRAAPGSASVAGGSARPRPHISRAKSDRDARTSPGGNRLFGFGQ